jgi:hypothetical protein
MYTIAEAYKYIENAHEGNDPLEYVFGDLLDTFTDNEIKVLAALTHFNRPAQLKWISEITNITKQVAETALEDLAYRSILIESNDAETYFLPPLAAQFIRRKRQDVVDRTRESLIEQASNKLRAINLEDINIESDDFAWDLEKTYFEAALYRLATTELITIFDTPTQKIDAEDLINQANPAVQELLTAITKLKNQLVQIGVYIDKLIARNRTDANALNAQLVIRLFRQAYDFRLLKARYNSMIDRMDALKDGNINKPSRKNL